MLTARGSPQALLLRRPSPLAWGAGTIALHTRPLPRAASSNRIDADSTPLADWGPIVLAVAPDRSSLPKWPLSAAAASEPWAGDPRDRWLHFWHWRKKQKLGDDWRANLDSSHRITIANKIVEEQLKILRRNYGDRWEAVADVVCGLSLMFSCLHNQTAYLDYLASRAIQEFLRDAQSPRFIEIRDAEAARKAAILHGYKARHAIRHAQAILKRGRFLTQAADIAIAEEGTPSYAGR